MATAAALLAASQGAAEPSAAPANQDGLRLIWTIPLDRFGKSEVQFQEEIRDPDYAREIQGRSLEGAADVDCAAGRFQLIRLVIYPLPQRGGEPAMRIGARPEWRKAEAGTTLGRVMSAACGSDRSAHAASSGPARAPTPVIIKAAAATPEPPSPVHAPPAAFAPAPAEWVATQRVLAAPIPEPAPIKASQPTAAPAPAPPKSPPAPVVQPVVAPTPKPVPQAPVPGPYYVQLAALPSADLAEQAWRGAQITNPAQLSGLREQTEVQRVNGVVYYRVLAGGFAREQDAAALCKALARGPKTCWVRRLQGGL